MRISSAMLKQEIETKLAQRIPAALSSPAQQAPRLYPTGNTSLDALLNGGLPLGSVCEFTGAEGSGRTSVALSLLATASCEGACAYLDVSDTLSPHSAAAAGVQLENLLWVRFGAAEQRSTEPSKDPVPEPTGSPASPPAEKSRTSVQQYGGGPHPRLETRDLAPALEQMLFDKAERRRRKMEGTPGYPNQPMGLANASQEQIEWERFNIRKVDEDDPLRRLNLASADAAREQAAVRMPMPLQQGWKPKTREPRVWDRLDRALRATDQVLQSGGFRAVVLDLASLPPEQALRIPSATWFRFRRAAQEGDAVLLLLTRQPCARSSAACVLECAPVGQPAIQGVLCAATHAAEVIRQRTGPAFGKKAPGRVTHWTEAPAWMRAVGS